MNSLLEEIKNIPNSKKDLKKFGLTLGLVFLLWSGLVVWRKGIFPEFILGLAVFFLSAGFLFPIILKPFQKAWMALACVLGWVMSRIILTVVFVVVITPIGFLTRLLGKDFMNRKFHEKKDTFWSDRVINNEDSTRHEAQF